jgi:disulfide bond formation protein DsbB
MSAYGSASPALRAAREWLIGGAAICLIALLIALLLQHVWEMQPCAWCVLQRLIYLGVAAACIAGAVMRTMRSRLSAVVIGLVLALSGLWAALYQQFVAAQSEACGLTLADKLIMALHLHELAPWLFVAYAPCDRANIALIGIPFALWSAALFVVLGLVLSLAGRALLHSRRGLFG